MTKVNYPSWDAKSWLEEFEASKQVQGGTRPVRAKVFQSTLEIVKSGGYRTCARVFMARMPLVGRQVMNNEINRALVAKNND